MCDWIKRDKLLRKDFYMVKDIEIYFLIYVLSILLFFFLFVNRDVDEIKDWIDEKDEVLNSDNFGYDLVSV